METVEAGVIQGSFLGPILFILFIADINKYLPATCSLKKYADDILAYLIGKHDNNNLPQEIADGVDRWCQANKMRLNEGKCKVIFIPDNKGTLPPVIKLSDKPLEIVRSYKYLGIDINTDLDWTQQSERIMKRIGPVPYLLKQLKLNGFREEILVSVYRSHLLSHIGYSSPALISAPSTVQTELQRAQTRALKIIGISDHAALEMYGLGTVRQFIERTCVNTIRRIVSSPDHPLAVKLAREEARETRASFRFELPIARTEEFNNSVVPWCIRVMRDGTASLYNPSTISKAATRLKRSASKKKNGTTAASSKTKAGCKYCGRLFEATRGVKIHESRCKSAPQRPTTNRSPKTPPSTSTTT